MAAIQSKVISDLTEVLNSKIHMPDIKKDSFVQKSVMNDAAPVLEQKHINKNQTQQKKVKAGSHTDADINWGAIVNKITMPSIIKFGTTLSGMPLGTLLGAAVGTGLGLAVGSKGLAAIGSGIGKYIGGAAGLVGGYQTGKYVVSKMDNGVQNDVIKEGSTQICVDAMTETVVEKEVDKNEFS